MKGSKTVTFLIAWRYNTDGKLSQANPIVTKKNNTSAKEIVSELPNGFLLSDGTSVIGKFTSYTEAKVEADKDVQKQQELK